MTFNTLRTETCLMLLDSLWKNSLTGLAIVDRTGKFLYVNPAFCKVVLYSEAEMQSKTFQDLTLPTDLSMEVEMSRRVASDPSTGGYDMRKTYIRKDNQMIQVELRCTGAWMNEVFQFFVTEIAPVEQRIAPRNDELESQARQSILWQGIKDYWVQIVFVLSILAGLIVQAKGGSSVER